MNALDALRMMAREYPGGLEAVALRLGKSPSTLEKELRAAPGYKFGANDAVAVTAMCHEMQVPCAAAFVSAAAASCSARVAVDLPVEAPSDVDIVKQCGLLLREVSGVVGAVTDASVDSRISQNELRRIEAEARDTMLVLQGLVAELERRHEQGKPAHLRDVL